MSADAALLQRRVVQYQAEAATWQARAERALRAGDAPLARASAARGVQWQRIAGQYADAHTAQQQSLEQVQGANAHLEARLDAVQVGGGPTTRTAARDWETVDAQWEQFERDQAMDALRRAVQS